MANWSENSPDEATNYITVLTNLRDRDKDVAKLFVADPTNPQESFFRYNRAGNKFQEYLSSVWTDKVLSIAGGGTGATSAAAIRTNLGLGTMSLQNDNAVNITGGTIAPAVTINAASITSGTVAQARLGSGSGGAGAKFLADNQTWTTPSSSIPIGSGMFHFGPFIPGGFLLCDGSAVSRSTYSNLYSQIGGYYGPGDGSTTFNLPNMVLRFPLGTRIDTPPLGLAAAGGDWSHSHTISLDGAHNHIVDPHQHTTDVHSHTGGSLSVSGHNHGGTVSGTTGSAGSHDHTFSDSFSGTTGGPSTGGPNPSGSGTDRASISHTHSFSDTISGTTSSDGSHSHSFSGTIPSASPSVSGTTSTGGGGLTSAAGPSTNMSPQHFHGGVTGWNNPPYIVLFYIIKY